MAPSDSELIARVVTADDRAAFGELVHRHQSAVRGFLRQLTRGDHAMADDLSQETFIRAYRTLARFRGAARFSTWLMGIAYNCHRNAARKQAFVAMDAEPGDETPSGMITADLRADLDQALQQLSADERLAVHLNFEQGLSHAEITRLVDWPLGTVKTHLARGKHKLRHLLSSWNSRT